MCIEWEKMLDEEHLNKMRYLIGSWYSAGGPDIKTNETLFHNWLKKVRIEGVYKIDSVITACTYEYANAYLVSASLWCSLSLEKHARNYLFKEDQEKT